MNISLRLNKLPIKVDHFTFSGGEEQVKIDTRFAPKGGIGYVDIYAELKSSKDVMVLVMLTNACRNLDGLDTHSTFNLHIPYIPYARQDRVMQNGEALAIKAFAEIINNLRFDKVVVDDPHSDVSVALLNNVTVRTQDVLISEYQKYFSNDAVIIAPDAGSRKKAQKVADRFGLSIVEASKVRDVKTGEITGTAVFGDVKGRECIIVDDIADGAFTFRKLGEKLKENGAKKVILYVTHGIFSKGVDILDGHIDEVYSYHPWMENIEGKNTCGIFKETSKGVTKYVKE